MSSGEVGKSNDKHWIKLHDNQNEKENRTEMCEFCGVLFGPHETTLKMCHGHIRSVCFRCLEEIAKQDRGVDLTKPE